MTRHPHKPLALPAAMAGLLAAHGVPIEQKFTLAVGARNGRVFVEMPKPVQLIDLAPDQAETMGQALLKHAAEAREQLQPSQPAATEQQGSPQ